MSVSLRAWLAQQRGFLTHRRGAGYVAAAVGVAAATAGIGLIFEHARISNVFMLYLLVVLATASRFGSGPAIAAAALSFFSFNWFFTEPRYTLVVYDPAEWVALLLFLSVALVTGNLAAKLRARADEALRREREAVALYDLGRVVAGGDDLDAALVAAAERLRRELQLNAAAVLLPEADGRLRVRATAGGPFGWAAAAATMSRVFHRASTRDGDSAPTSRLGRWIRIRRGGPGGRATSLRLARLSTPNEEQRPQGRGGVPTWFVPLQTGGRTVGALGLAGAPTEGRFTPEEERLLAAAADQIANAIQRERLHAEATQAEVLRRSDELRAALLRAVSHDLRTPLASIKAAAGSLRRQDMRWSKAEHQSFAETIEAEADRLNLIVGHLLDLSRIEAGALRLEKDWYPLAALVDDVLGRLRPRTVQHWVRVDIPEDLPPVPLDYVAIDQVLTNLIENAVKYAPRGTEVRVTAARERDCVRIAMADGGPGVPPEALPYLFEPFYRVPAGRGARVDAARVAGSGLGLAVAKGLVEAHGGRVWAESAPGEGTCITFTVPLGIADADRTVPAAEVAAR